MYNKAVTSERDVNHVIINTLADIKKQILQRDWGTIIDGAPYNQIMLPNTALALVSLIDETLKTSPIPTEEALIKTLKLIDAIPAEWLEYKDIKMMTHAMCIFYSIVNVDSK